MISPHVAAIFQLKKLMHTSAYYLLQNSHYLNCIQRFVCLNECLKFVWALHRIVDINSICIDINVGINISASLISSMSSSIYTL